MININEYQAIHENKSHFDYNIPYNTYPCTIPLDFESVPLHWHEDAEFISGSVELQVYELETKTGDVTLYGSFNGRKLVKAADFMLLKN